MAVSKSFEKFWRSIFKVDPQEAANLDTSKFEALAASATDARAKADMEMFVFADPPAIAFAPTSIATEAGAKERLEKIIADVTAPEREYSDKDLMTPDEFEKFLGDHLNALSPRDQAGFLTTLDAWADASDRAKAERAAAEQAEAKRAAAEEARAKARLERIDEVAKTCVLVVRNYSNAGMLLALHKEFPDITPAELEYADEAYNKWRRIDSIATNHALGPSTAPDRDGDMVRELRSEFPDLTEAELKAAVEAYNRYSMYDTGGGD